MLLAHRQALGRQVQGRPAHDRPLQPSALVPHRTPKAVVKRVVSLRMHLREGPVQRAASWFSARGVTVERVLSDNGAAYRSQAWKAACRQLGIKAKRTRPYRPQTNGKIERFHRTLSDGWAYARHYDSETQRRQALPAWLHLYNHHRPHTATHPSPA